MILSLFPSKLFSNKKGISKINLLKPEDKTWAQRNIPTFLSAGKWTGEKGGAAKDWVSEKFAKHQASRQTRIQEREAESAQRMASAVERSMSQPPSLGLLFLLFLIFHFFDAATNYQFGGMRITLHVTFAIIVWFVLGLYNVDQRTRAHAFTIAGITILLPFILHNFVFPLLAKIGVINPSSISDAVGIFMIFFPLWLFYFLAIPHKKGWADSLAFLFYFILAILYIPGFVLSAAEKSGVDVTKLASMYGIPAGGAGPEGTAGIPGLPGTSAPPTSYNSFEVATESTKALITRARQSIAVIPDKIEELFYMQVKEAAGDYYIGQVEQNKDQPLGVYIENLKSAAPSFYEDEAVTVWGTVRARTLDSDKEVNISLSCYSPVVGEQFVKGLTNASFLFRTDSYMKAYFMEKNTMRSLHRQGIDPLRQYGIFEKQPIAIFTNGPAHIGMKTTESEFGALVPVDQETNFRFGLTLSNRWEGEILKVNQLFIKLPPGAAFDTNTCDFVPEEIDCRNLGDAQEASSLCDPQDTSQIVYRVGKASERDDMLRVTKRGLDRLFAIDKFVTLTCKVKVTSPDALLGVTPLATHYFKVTTIYDYMLRKTMAVSRKRVPEFRGPFAQPPVVTTPEAVDEAYQPSEPGVPRAIRELAVSPTACIGLGQFCGGTAKGYPDLFPRLRPCCVKVDTESYICEQERRSCGNSLWCATGGYTCSADPGDPNYDSRFNPENSIKALARLHASNFKRFSDYAARNEFAIASYNAGSAPVRLAVEAAKQEGVDNPTWSQVYAKMTPELFQRSSSTYSSEYFTKNNNENLRKKIAGLGPYVEHIMNYANYAHQILYPPEPVS
ncbi:MAG: hypothetical protein QT07_C0009G0013 [archaeon GW2011_AR16]|nr:MAG: hypothetical protein QT07_C0009G0013 [archaeon GW2011_AR16]